MQTVELLKKERHDKPELGKSVRFIMRSDLVVLEHLRPFLLVRRGDEVALHVKDHRLQMNSPDHLKAFELLQQNQRTIMSQIYLSRSSHIHM